MLFLVILSLVLCAVRGQNTTNISSCTSNTGALPIHAYIEGCIDQPCLFPQGEYAVMNVIFQAPDLITDLTTTAYADLFFGINYPLGEVAAACNYLQNSYCPILKDEVLQYKLDFCILSIFPTGLPVPLELYISDQNGNRLFCLRINLQVTSASENPTNPCT